MKDKKLGDEQTILTEEIRILQERIEELEKSETRLRKTEQSLKEAYEELKATQSMLVQAEKLHTVGILVSGIAHEVKNPLGIILQGIEYLEKKLTAADETVSNTLNMIRDGIKRADNIICSLFDFTRSDSFKLKPDDINDILESALTLIQQKLKFEHIDIIKDLQKDMPKVLVDRNRIEQVFINVVLNSIQSITKKGKITIRSYDSQSEEAKGHLDKISDERFEPGEKVAIVEIEDTGIGIPEENLKKLFIPFFTTKRPGKGIGLGLPVSKSIIDMHNGLIQIKSKEGKGTKVLIFLDIAR